MAAMKFKFTIQDYQTEAVESVTRVFNGQPCRNMQSYLQNIREKTADTDLFKGDLFEREYSLGYRNAR